jgi:hypothetical protein
VPGGRIEAAAGFARGVCRGLVAFLPGGPQARRRLGDVSPAAPPPLHEPPGRGRAVAAGVLAVTGLAAGARALWLAGAARRFADVRGDRFDRPGTGR